MCCGVPCVVTDVGDSAWIVGGTGIVVPPRDPESLTKGWSGLMTLSCEDRTKLGMQARRRMIDNFSLGPIVKQYEDLYESFIGSVRS